MVFFYMSTYEFYILKQKKSEEIPILEKNLAFRAKFVRKSTSRSQNRNFPEITKNVTAHAQIVQISDIFFNSVKSACFVQISSFI